MTPVLSISRRTRRTPFTDRVSAAGVAGYTIYNHMLLPTMFRSVVEDYRHLKTAVQVWDVACERQVEICGPQAAELVQMLTPRDLSAMQIGQCLYTPMVDETGGMLNDPVTVKLDEDRYWISIADSDLLFWVKALAIGYRMTVDVFEPDVSPLAIQGPQADELVARVFGEEVRSIRFFRYKMLDFNGTPFVVARSGYSKQGGFEVYVHDTKHGEPLWDALFSAGLDLDVRAGCPNLIERIEAGLLSYGNDMTQLNTPHECGLGRFCDTKSAIGCIGRDALLRVAEEGPQRQIRYLEIDGDAVPPCNEPWEVVSESGPAGQVTSAAWSPDFSTNTALAMIDREVWDEGTRLTVETPTGLRGATVHEKSWL